MASLKSVNDGMSVVSPLPTRLGEAAATDQRQSRGGGTERRTREYPNPERRSIYDLLFYEVDSLEDVERPVRDQLKESIRSFFREKRRDQDRSREDKRRAQDDSRRREHEARRSQDPLTRHRPVAEDVADRPKDVEDLRVIDFPADDAFDQVVVPDEHTFQHGQIMELSLPGRSAAEKERILEGLRIVNQLNSCLAINTEPARRVSLYLRALLILNATHHRPQMIIEV
ncbi:MAG: hypothetical protein GC191_04520 [Azospirillum sp.]|nr:hypothetical protein [Azospirillum sp.]